MLTETLDGQRRWLIPAPHSTLILVIAGDFAQGLANGLGKRLGELGGGSGPLVELLATEPPAMAALKDRIARAAEANLIRYPDAEVEVRVLLSTWDLPDLEVTSVLGDFGSLLDRLAVGNQSLTVTLLMPSSTAQSADLRRSAEVIRSVAGSVGELPFLTSATVVQLPGEVFRDGMAATGGFASGDDLLEVLMRNAIDLGAGELTKRLGASVTAAAASRADREPACFSSVGLQRVVYLQVELLRYLRARFQLELYERGLFNPAAVMPARRSDLAQQAEELLGAQVQRCSDAIPELGAAPAMERQADTAGSLEISDRSPLKAAEVKRALHSGESRLRGRLDEILNGFEQNVRRQLDLALDATPGFFADGLILLDAIAGSAAQSEPPVDPSGLFRAEEQLCTAPLHNLIQAHLLPHLHEAIARCGLQRAPEDELADQTLNPLQRSVGLLSRAEDALPAGLDALAGFLTEVGGRLVAASETRAATAADSEALILAIAGSLVSANQGINDALEQTKGELEAIAEQLREVENEYPIWRFWHLGRRSHGKGELKENARALGERQTELLASNRLAPPPQQ